MKSVMLSVALFVALSFAQTERWVYRYNNPANSHALASAMVCGEDSNLYATGLSKDSTWKDVFTVIGLDPNGTERWVYRYTDSTCYHSWGKSIVCGSDGNLYITGAFGYSVTNGDLTIISLDTNGQERWVYRKPEDDEALLLSVTYGSDGNVYAAGGIRNAFAIISVDTIGQERWEYRYHGPGNGPNGAQSIVCGLDGNIYAAGSGWDDVTNVDLVVVSVDQNGTERWVYRFDGTGHSIDRAHSIICGSDGNLYIVGESFNFAGILDFIVISLDTNGQERWVYLYYGPENGLNAGYSITYGLDDNIYAAGSSTNIATGTDITVVSIDTIGIENWVYTYNSPWNHAEIGLSIDYGADNNIYVGGWSEGNNTDKDFIITSVNQNGNERWVYRFDGAGHDNDRAHSIVHGADGNVYAAGFSTDSVLNWNFTVISLDPTTGVEEEKALHMESKNFGPTILNGPLVLSGDKNCRVFDITGRVVLPDKIRPGIYFIEIDGKMTRKVVKVR